MQVAWVSRKRFKGRKPVHREQYQQEDPQEPTISWSKMELSAPPTTPQPREVLKRTGWISEIEETMR